MDMPACPACGGRTGRSERFPEGAIHACRGCGLQWAERFRPMSFHYLDPTGVNARYVDPASIDAGTYPPYADFFARLEATGRRPGRLLDVGCGNGVFLAEALGRGWDAMGIEPDPAMRARMDPAIASRVVPATVEEAGDLGGRFDVVTFWDSFEHIADPFPVLESLRPHLAPGAPVFLRVNNRRDIFNLAADVAQALRLPVAPRLVAACFNLPQHYWNFSERAMRLMLARHGWRVDAWRPTETPASRLIANPLTKAVIEVAYLLNRLIGGGKIGEYWISQ